MMLGQIDSGVRILSPLWFEWPLVITVIDHIRSTWSGESNEQWSPVLGLETVLRSIQSLLAPNPYNLEPGFENDDDEEQSELYNAKVG